MNETNQELSQHYTDLCAARDHPISVWRVSYRPHELKPAVVTNQIENLNNMTETNQINE